MKKLALAVWAIGCARGDVGTLIPMNKQAPDAAVLQTAETAIDIFVDGSNARVVMRQIFANKTGSMQEGNYVFALPANAIVSDFAVWDGPVRIPGVILERKRAEELYENIRLQAIDPGLLQLGESDSDEGRRTRVFSAKVVPIPAYGVKRVELEYHQRLPLENLTAYLAVPLKPEAYRTQTAGRLWITLDIQGAHNVEAFEVLSKSFPLRVAEQTPRRIRASLEARNFNLTEDFAFTMRRGGAAGMAVLAQRDEPGEAGYFEASLTLPPAPEGPAPPRHITVLFDASLSMQWDKLERAYAALAKLLEGLSSADQFELIAFNSKVARFASGPTPGGREGTAKALDWRKEQPLRGATNLSAALDAALETGAGAVVLLTDGGASDGEIRSGRIAASYASKWNASKKPRTFVFGVGDDVNANLLQALARQDGVFESVGSTEALDFKLNAFLSKLRRRPVAGLSLAPDSNLLDVYPLQEQTYDGSEAAWTGRYRNPARTVFRAGTSQLAVALPASETSHPQLPHTWAKARVDALLEKIDRDGEDRASIEEIIRLSRKYKFVTPYTSFLAAPRALLRPRLIRPGDPVLRVRTDPLITSVVAVFPFGEVKTLRHLKDEGVWQTRFLAPADLADGTHPVDLVLRDKHGRTYKETRTFVIIGKPPVVRASSDKRSYRAGELVQLRVSATETTRRITARTYGAAPVELRWNAAAGANTGRVALPADLPAGRYTISIVAEDMAHNIGSAEVAIDVVP